MKGILNSATKLTLLMLIVALIVLTFLGTVDEETFKTVIVMVVSYYFGVKSNLSSNSSDNVSQN